MASVEFKSDERFSQEARKKLRAFCGNLGENIVALANELGVKVFEEELLPYESGYLEYDPSFHSDSGYRIVINERHPPERQRFTVAHELAHFLLHKNDIDYLPRQQRHRANVGFGDLDPFYYSDPQDSAKEIEANRFAAALLMPPNLFIPIHRRLNGDIFQIARVFEVSVQAATRRVAELKKAKKIL